MSVVYGVSLKTPHSYGEGQAFIVSGEDENEALFNAAKKLFGKGKLTGELDDIQVVGHNQVKIFSTTGGKYVMEFAVMPIEKVKEYLT
jgi:hypothetical protein